MPIRLYGYGGLISTFEVSFFEQWIHLLILTSLYDTISVESNSTGKGGEYMEKSLLQGERKFIEYKRVYSKTFLKTVSAYANYHSGWILFGIDDSGELIGVPDPEGLKLSIEHGINDALDPLPYYEIDTFLHDGYSVVALHVSRGEHTPYMCSGKAYRRRDTSTVQVDRIGLTELILIGRNSGYDEIEYPEDDLSFALLQSRLKKDKGISKLTDDLMKTLELKKNSHFTNAAALFSDYNPLKTSVVNLVAFKDKSVREITDREVLEEVSIIEQYESCMRFYRKHINIGEKIEGAYRETVEEVPLVAYREAITNAIVHRDYTREVAVRVEVFSDRIEIVSPGSLPVGLSVEEYEEGSVSLVRNRIVADLFRRLGIIEKFGTGVIRIKEYYRDLPIKPSFVIYENSVTVILPRINEASLSSGNSDMSNYKLTSDREKLVYELLKKNGTLARKDIEEALNLKRSQSGDLLKSMKDKRIITMVGNGRSSRYSLVNR